MDHGKLCLYSAVWGRQPVHRARPWTLSTAWRWHSSGKGAKYTRSHLPVELAYQEQTEDWPAALRREAAIKRMSRAQKLALIAEYANADPRKERP